MAWLLDKKIKRVLPEKWKGIIPTDIFLNEAKIIVNKAEKKDITLRIMGGLAIALHSNQFQDFSTMLKRVGTGMVEGQEYSDIDFMTYRKDRKKTINFFRELGYAKRRATLSSAASERQIYYHPKGWFYVDVFFDKLIVANHPLDFKERLKLDYPTISVTDLLLEKIQMWEAFSKKDLKDCLILIKAHDIKEVKTEDSINAGYIAKLLAHDWGFWYTATSNLKKIKSFINNLDKLGPEIDIKPRHFKSKDQREITDKIDTLLNIIDREPKSLKWKMRAKAGTKVKWYNHVETPESVGGFGIWEALHHKE